MKIYVPIAKASENSTNVSNYEKPYFFEKQGKGTQNFICSTRKLLKLASNKPPKEKK